jgi:nicotinamidase-related amidase
MPVLRFKPDATSLLVVDVQEKLLPHIHDADGVEAQVGRMIDGAARLDLPILVTEQYRKGLGVTVPGVAARLAAARCNEEKLRFSACIEPVCRHLRERGSRSVIVCGIEAHVCVLQTCLDLLHAGYVTGLVVDAIGSRRPVDRDTAVLRLIQAGVVPTTVESVLLEMVGEAGTPLFKSILPVIK